MELVDSTWFSFTFSYTAPKVVKTFCENSYEFKPVIKTAIEWPNLQFTYPRKKVTDREQICDELKTNLVGPKLAPLFIPKLANDANPLVTPQIFLPP